MPAIDICEPAVIRALEKAGWMVLDQPYSIRFDESRLDYVFADLRLRHNDPDQTIIVVEVKCFAVGRSFLDEFYHATGQYIVYRNALKIRGIDLPVYLAVPLRAYKGFFQKRLIQSAIDDVRAKIVVVDLDAEEVAQWID